jgi:hypothetical protein
MQISKRVLATRQFCRNWPAWVFLAPGLLLPAIGLAQNWTPGAAHSMGGSQIHRIAVGILNGEKTPGVFVVDESDLWFLRGDGKGGFIDPGVIWRTNVRDVALGKFGKKGEKTADLIALLPDSSGQAAELYLLASPSSQSAGATAVAPGMLFALGCSIVAGDFNDNGLDDLAIGCTETSGAITIGLNQGQAAFKFVKVPLPAGRAFKKIVAGDFDGDGKADLQILSLDQSGAPHQDVLWGTGNGAFSIQQTNAVDIDTDLAAGDFDGNGAVDFVGFSNGEIVPFTSGGSTRAFDALAPIEADSECSIQAIGLGATHRNMLNVRALDIVAAEECSGGESVRIFTNQAATQMELKVKIARKGDGFTATITAAIAALIGTALPQGQVVFDVNGTLQPAVSLEGGAASLDVPLSGRVIHIAALYQSSNAMAWSASQVIVHGPVVETGAKLRRSAPQAGSLQRLVFDKPEAARFVPVATYYEGPGWSSTTVSPTTINAGSSATVTATMSAGFSYDACSYGDQCPNDAWPYGNVYGAVDGAQTGTVAEVVNSYSPIVDDPNCGEYDPNTGWMTDYCYQGSWDQYQWSTSSLASGSHQVGLYFVVSGSECWQSVNGYWDTDMYCYQNGPSPTATVNVAGKVTPGVSVYCSPNPITYGSQTTTCYSSLSGGASPTGAIYWTIDGGGWTTTGINGSAGGFNGYPAGAHTIGVTYSGDGSNNSVGASTTLTIQQTSTSLSINCSGSTVYGSVNVDCSPSLSGAYNPGAAMSWGYSVNGGGCSPGSWVSGWSPSQAVGNWAGFPAESITVCARFIGDGNNGASNIASTSFAIQKANPSMSVSYSPDPIPYGQNTSCTAAVGSGATGSVTFTDNGAAWAIVGLNGGSASASGYAGHAGGSYTLGAIYSGDSNFYSASASTTVVVQPITPSVSVSCSPASLNEGAQTTCTANVPNGDGVVYFYWPTALTGEWWNAAFPAGGGSLAQKPIAITHDSFLNYNISADEPWAGSMPAPPGVAASNIYARWTGTFVSPVSGTYTIGVNSDDGANIYVGGQQLVNNLSNDQGAARDRTYTQSGTISLSAGSLNRIVVEYQQGGGDAGIQLLWTIPGASGATLLGWGAVSVNGSGQASISGADLVSGSSTVTATWSGDADYISGSATASLNATANTVSEGASSLNPSTAGQSVTFSGLVDTGGSLPSGVLDFDDSGAEIGTRSVQSVSTTNLFSGSTDMGSAAYWFQDTDTATSNSGVAPDGSNTATEIIATGGDPGTGQTVSTGAISNRTFTASVWVKAVGNASTEGGRIFLFGSDWSTIQGCAVPSISVLWTRYSCTITFGSDPGSAGLYARFDFPDSSPVSGDTVYIWGPQLEESANVGPYVMTDASLRAGYGGVATLTTSTLSGGVHSITTSYSGDGALVPSTSLPLAQVVNEATPTVTTWPIGSVLSYGQTLASSALSGGAASIGGTFTWATPGTLPTVGTNSYQVIFTPTDSVDYSSVSGAASVTVRKSTPTVVLGSSANPSTYGGSVMLTATVSAAESGAMPSGSVTFMDGATAICNTVALSGGLASCNVVSLAAGSHSITASYSGDSNYVSATSAELNQTVNKATLTVGLASSVNPSVYGTSVTFAATVPSDASGTITFYDGSALLGSAPVLGTGAMLATNVLNAGNHLITAQYSGDSNNNTSTSPVVSQMVNPSPVAITGTSSLNPSTYGKNVTLTFDFSGTGAVPSGTATIALDRTAVGTVTLDAAGKATYTTPTLSAGTHAITAIYNGSQNYF